MIVAYIINRSMTTCGCTLAMLLLAFIRVEVDLGIKLEHVTAIISDSKKSIHMYTYVGVLNFFQCCCHNSVHVNCLPHKDLLSVDILTSNIQ